MIVQDSRQNPGSVHVDKNHIFLELDTIRELFIAPDFDPFSEKETEYMGQSARERVIRQLRPGWTLRARHWQLTIRLPPDQITPGLADQITGAIYRFCRTKIDDNTIHLRNVRWKGIRKLPFGFTFLAICISLGSLRYYRRYSDMAGNYP
jgi:hypothetical protein